MEGIAWKDVHNIKTTETQQHVVLYGQAYQPSRDAEV